MIYKQNTFMGPEATPIIEILKQIPLFQGLTEEDHSEIIKNVKKEVFPANYRVFKQGDMGDKMYIVRKGEIKVVKEDHGEPKEIAVLGVNGFFGEMALISSKLRNATCITTVESELLSLDRNDFKKLIRSNKGIASRITKEYFQRNQENKHREESIGEQNLF